MHKLEGIPVSGGMALGACFVLRRPVLMIPHYAADPAQERQRLQEAFGTLEEKIRVLIAREAQNQTVKGEPQILEAHLLMLEDPDFRQRIEQNIATGINAEAAVEQAGHEMASRLLALPDAYLADRATDIQEVTYRLQCHLLHQTVPGIQDLQNPAVLVTRELAPADTIGMNRNLVLGILSETGGVTSHASIIARSLGIPAVSGLPGLLDLVQPGQQVCLDGTSGQVLLDPDAETRLLFTRHVQRQQEEEKELAAYRQAPTQTRDGHSLLLAANIAHAGETVQALSSGAQGIGLMRSEFLYMESKDSFPGEEEQYRQYVQVLRDMKGHDVIIRTLDIGGDKQLRYYRFPEEENPFLGVRAIRFGFAHEEILRTQIRALLRASVCGSLRIMFPMIATREEFSRARAIVQEEKDHLQRQGIPVSPAIRLGLMIEIPAAALQAESLAGEADFFSIGTNDLIQYTLAADRLNPGVQYLYQPFHPAVLKLIQMSIAGAHARGIPCGICGEMAADPAGALLLCGMGADALSCSPALIPSIRRTLHQYDYAELQQTAQQALQQEDAGQVRQCLAELMERRQA